MEDGAEQDHREHHRVAQHSQMTAGGTQATEGSDWSPERMGPIAARTNFTRATSKPSGVPMARAKRNPSRPRETLVQM